MPGTALKALKPLLACGLTAFALQAPASIVPVTEEIETTAGIFDLYERNRREGVPNYVTEDLLLVSYGLIRVSVGKSLERERGLLQVRELVASLFSRLQAQTGDVEATDANRDYLAVLAALLDGADRVSAAGKPKRAQAELDLVLAASSTQASPLWGRRMDYTQFVPRGHYAQEEDLTRYFRAVRYAGAALLAVQPSQATGVRKSDARRMAQQARQLAELIEADAALVKLHGEILAEQAWRFGPAEDLPNAAVLAVAAEPRNTYAERLLAHARAQALQPRILGDLVDRNRLERGVTAQDALTGWRLLPQRRTPDYAAFQHLVFDGTGAFEGVGDSAPFGLTMVEGQAVKGFPLLAELMTLWGSKRSARQIKENGEGLFAGYPEAKMRAAAELAEADGLAALHQQLVQTALAAERETADRLIALRSFWTWQRYASVLYAKQPYTPAGKGLPAPDSRTDARLEPSLALYQSLLRVVEGHRRFAPHPSWNAFAEILERVVAIAARQRLSGQAEGGLSERDVQFLNSLDLALKAITGEGDSPIVVDVHVNASSREVLQEATGQARAVLAGGSYRGGRFTQCEFKQPMADRLTDAKWRERLSASDHPCAGLSPRLVWQEDGDA